MSDYNYRETAGKLNNKESAVCISHEDLNRKLKDLSLSTDIAVLPRWVCDNTQYVPEDYGVPEFLQLIPYITLYAQTDDGIKVLTYSRGAAGGEARLVKRSCGFGGHIDADDLVQAMSESSVTGSNSFADLVLTAADRELWEEISLSLIQNFCATALEQIENAIPTVILEDEVSRVHALIPIAMELPLSHLARIVSNEAGVIEDIKIADLPELLEGFTALEPQNSVYEAWSREMHSVILSQVEARS